MKRGWKFLLPAMAGAMALATTGPASATAAAVGVGVSSGTVHLVPGIVETSPTSCATQAFTFTGVSIVGAAVAVSTAPAAGTFVGDIEAGSTPDGDGTITGGTTGDVLGLCSGATENLLSAKGSINKFYLHGWDTVGVGSLDGSVTGGSYERLGPVVLVNLPTTATVCGPGGCVAGSGTASVAALFVGTSPGQSPAQDFAFAGPFALAATA
jgi:hypothetical protein